MHSSPPPSAAAPVLLGSLRPAAQPSKWDKQSLLSDQSSQTNVFEQDKSSAEGAPDSNSLRSQMQENGNLFLTCLRLRFEERGSWSKALAEPHEEIAATGCGEDGTLDASQEAAVESRNNFPQDSADWRQRFGFAPRGSTRALLQRFLRGGSREAAEPLDGAEDNSGGLAFESQSRNIFTSQTSSRRRESGDVETDALVSRRPGVSDHCVAVTVEPLPSLSPERVSLGRRGIGGDVLCTRQFYFEFEVLELFSSPTTQAPAIGFVWPPLRETSGELSLPQFASQLPRSLILGGEPSRAHVSGRMLGFPVSWRPLIHIEAGSIVGACLEVDQLAGNEQSLRMKVFQDGVQRCEVQERIQSHDSWDTLACSDPHAVIDLCGNIRCVQVRKGRPATVTVSIGTDKWMLPAPA